MKFKLFFIRLGKFVCIFFFGYYYNFVNRDNKRDAPNLFGQTFISFYYENHRTLDNNLSECAIRAEFFPLLRKYTLLLSVIERAMSRNSKIEAIKRRSRNDIRTKAQRRTHEIFP